jgi:hypothetical protein
MDKHARGVSGVYDSLGVITTGKHPAPNHTDDTLQGGDCLPARETDALYFLENLFDRKFYRANATESLAVGLFDKRAKPLSGLNNRDTHFSCALFESNTSESVNNFRRTKERWTGAVGVVLDDIGETKGGVLIKAPPVEPTAIIETKPGSFQWVYLFKEIERDPLTIEAIQRSAIAGGMCDPGAGNITRITRLPGSTPEGKTHQARLVWADWTRRFNAAAIIDKALQVPRIEAPKAQEHAAPNLSDETSEAGKGTLEAACYKIRNAEGVTGSGTINAQSFFIGQQVGAGLIALADADAALFAAAHDRHPADGIRQTKNGLQAGILKPLTRQSNGRFTGSGATPLTDQETQAGPVYQEIQAARDHIRDTLQGFVKRALEYDDLEGGTPPVMALAATPGAGKTGAALRELAGADLSKLPGDVVFSSPTLALAEQAARNYEEISGKSAHVTRGRSAKIPGTESRMCQRHELAERVVRAGLIVKATLCEVTDTLGRKHRCPHFRGCAYLEQWGTLPEKPVTRFEASAYLELPGDGSGRKTGLRVIDETIWRQFSRNTDLTPADWIAPRHGDPFTAVDATDAAQAILAALMAGKSLIGGKYSAEDFAAFKAAEKTPINMRCTPDSDDSEFATGLDEIEARTSGTAGRNAALWAVLEDCARRGIEATERVRLITTKTGATMIRVTWFKDPPADTPTLLLDADATGPILERMYPGAELVAVDLKPNAHVVQLTDRTFSNTKLQKVTVRRELVRLVRAEVLRDVDKRGVLCIATRKAVRAMFEDAGHDFTGQDNPTVSKMMMETPLHGARWLWFGPASLGRNDWQDFGTALVMGREDIGVDALEDYARALFGDTGDPLQFVQPDAKGQRFMPEAVLPLVMEDGEQFGIFGRAHPDTRVRALQVQTREMAARQAIERLRLVNATERKRVVICTTVPVPGLPVSDLLRWDQLVPSRLEAAIAEANQRTRVLRLSASGLCSDAPETFETVQAAEEWLRREGKEAIADLTRHTGNSTLLPVQRVIFSLRINSKGARTTRAVILGDDPRATAEQALGALAAFEIVEVIERVQSVEQAATAPPAPLPDKAPAPTPERATQPRDVVSLPDTREDAERPPQRRFAGRGGP